MTAVPIADFAAHPLEYLRRSQAGERFEIVQDGRPVAQLAPAAAGLPTATTADEDDREPWWRGTYAPELPRKPIPGFVPPSEPIVLERRPLEPDFGWLPERDADDE